MKELMESDKYQEILRMQQEAAEQGEEGTGMEDEGDMDENRTLPVFAKEANLDNRINEEGLPFVRCLFLIDRFYDFCCNFLIFFLFFPNYY